MVIADGLDRRVQRPPVGTGEVAEHACPNQTTRRLEVVVVSRFRAEIVEQQVVAARMLSDGRAGIASIGARVRDAGPRGFVIAARGSSDHAALYAKYLFGQRNRTLVALAAPSLFTHYASPPRLDDQCVIGISQSGASPDVIAVIEEAARQGSITIAVTNDPESRLARAAALVLRRAL